MPAGQWILVIVLVAMVWMALSWWLRSRAGEVAMLPSVVPIQIRSAADVGISAPTLGLTREDEPEPAAAQAAVMEVVAIEPPADDLSVVKGIGPKISAALVAAGIRTYQALAELEPAEIKRIVNQAGIHLGEPTTWPEQAGLAAERRWQELAELQSLLQEGHRT